MIARLSFLLIIILPLLVLTGCGSKRWSDPLQEEESLKISELIGTMQDADKSCPKNLDADAIMHWKSMVGNSAVNGYLQLQSPSSLKFIISNPLGMLYYAFASDGKTFQILDTDKRQHIRGNLRSLAMRHELPLILIHGDWVSLLSGHLPSPTLVVESVSRDTGNQTIWAKVSTPAANKTSDEQWVNIDVEKRKVLGYLFLDSNGKIIADISYGDQGKGIQNCLSTDKKIHIKNLPWGSEIKIELRDIRTDTLFSHSDFTLPVPKGYFKQLQP